MRSLRRWRIYWLILVVGVVFLLVNPFALIEWRIFVRDFGLELKKNAQAGSDPFWQQYAVWWWEWESVSVLIVAMIGVWAGWQKQRRATVLLLVYLGLMIFMIGTATRGFVRYLSPIVPIMAVLAGMGAAWLWQKWRWVLLILLVVSGVELSPKVSAQIARAQTVDYMHEGFQIAYDLQPNTVYAAGFTPIQEMRHAGFAYRHLSDAELQGEGFSADWQTSDLLLVDRSKRALLNGNWQVVWSTEEGLGLYLLR